MPNARRDVLAKQVWFSIENAHAKAKNYAQLFATAFIFPKESSSKPFLILKQDLLVYNYVSFKQ